MLNKLRLKFVGISLTVFGIVLLSFFMVTYRNATFEIKSNSIMLLEQLSKNFGKQLSSYPTKINTVIPPNFTIFYDENGKIIETLTVSNPVGFSGDNTVLLQKLVDTVLEGDTQEGILTIYETPSLRYKIAKDTLPRITFMSQSYERMSLEKAYTSAIKNTLYLTIILLLTSIILSIWTFKPIKKAWAAQNQFIADASHELRTPLTAIQANLDVVLSDDSKSIAEQKKWLIYIKNEVSRMKNLSNDLLLLFNNESVEKNKHHIPIDLSNIISSTVLSLESLAFESNKVLELSHLPNVTINGDSDQIKQLLIILIDNAIKYAPHLSHIEVSLSKNNNRVFIKIENEVDDKIDTTKIFDRFYREDSSRNRKSGGNGLGLSIAKTIVDSHKGKIYAKNVDDKLMITCAIPIKTRLI